MNAFRSPEGKQAVIDYYNRLLKQITVPYEEVNTATRYGDTFLLAAGDKANQPGFLLHGSSMNSAMWIKDIERLSEYYRVYAPDLPGEPGRSDEGQLPFDSLDYVDWLSDVLEAMNIEKTDIAGLSLGAWLAAKFSIHHPQRVNKLVMLCPAGIGGQNHAFKDIALSLLSKGEEGVDELFFRINGDKPIPEIMLNYQKCIAAAFNSRQEPIPIFTDQELERLTMPSLLIAGEKDIMLNSLETAQRVKKLVKNSKIMVLPDAGHSLTGLADEIIGFLTQ